MSVTAGALSLLSVASTTASLLSAPATAGTGPYTYQWYRSTTSGFSPGGGNIIAGATSLSLNDSGLIPGTQYYYGVVATDTGASGATSASAQLGVQTTAPTLSQNQFSQVPILGMIDLRYAYDTVSAQVDLSQATPLYAGQAVKVVASTDGVPKVVACAADSDQVFGFINFDIKSANFPAGSACELSMSGNFIYLYATTAINRGTQVQLDLTTVGGVAAKVGSSGANIVGFAFDQAAAAGALIRVKLGVPSFLSA
jgi:hypothetical protein